jgi:hypothetical protein
MTRKTTPTALRRAQIPEADDPESTDRPTVNPPFDVEMFARESDSKVRSIGGQPSPPDAPEITGEAFEDPVAQMRERFALGDYTGALELAELILTDEPGNLDAAECGEDCRTALESMLASRLGSLDGVPIVSVPRSQLRWLSLDHRAGFVLSLVDDSSTVEMILDVCGMPKLDALRILDDLVRQKIISFR